MNHIVKKSRVETSPGHGSYGIIIGEAAQPESKAKGRQEFSQNTSQRTLLGLRGRSTRETSSDQCEITTSPSFGQMKIKIRNQCEK